MPQQKPGQSKQDYATPPEFIRAVQRRLGLGGFTHDFAADATNAKAPTFWSAEDDALQHSIGDWELHSRHGWSWLNPPYSDIGPWAARCLYAKEMGGNIAFLVPASVGSNWYRDFVHNKALVLALNGRLAFMPDKPDWLYPKDCVLCLYSPRVTPGFDVWNWRAE